MQSRLCHETKQKMPELSVKMVKNVAVSNKIFIYCRCHCPQFIVADCIISYKKKRYINFDPYKRASIKL